MRTETEIAKLKLTDESTPNVDGKYPHKPLTSKRRPASLRPASMLEEVEEAEEAAGVGVGEGLMDVG